MTTPRRKEQDHFDLAFELAYYIHVNKEIAFFVAEDALDGLGSMLDHHEKNRTPSERLRGFLKSGERNRPIRKTIRLNEPQMLQWLVYKQSQIWERQTEGGEGLYLPTDEDMIVRYIEHLVFMSLRRGSFYVSLAVGPLLHQFDRRETRVFYDILTQSDSARMKDTNYIGKQRLDMLEKVSRRFGDMIETVNRPGDEKQFVMRPTTDGVLDLVNESLRRFTPWQTACLVKTGFDVTDIPGLYFSEAGTHDEDVIEMNRIHTVLDPVCFATFADGLSRYVRTLPNEDQDKACSFSLDGRLKVPQFSGIQRGSSRGDRSQPPKLTREDYIRLQRTLDARAHRRKVFVPQRLNIYIDDVLSHTLDPKTRSGRWLIGDAAVIEVRGQDTVGELPLATILWDNDGVSGDAFGDSVVHPSGLSVSVWLTPLRDADRAVKGAQLEVVYHPALKAPVFLLLRRVWSDLTGKDHEKLARSVRFGYPRLAKIGIALTLIMLASALIWWQITLRSTRPETRLSELTGQLHGAQQVEQKTPVAVTPTPLPSQSPPFNDLNTKLARATWSMDRDAALHAIQLEITRSETHVMDLSPRAMRVLLRVPRYDDVGRSYPRYRLTLYAAESRLWLQTLAGPRVSLTRYDHILNLLLFSRRLPDTGPFILQVEGDTQGGWQLLGKVRFDRKE